MKEPKGRRVPSRPSSRGMTLVELLVTMTILAAVILVVTGILIRSSRLEGRTVRRAELQAATRQALALLTTELRQAGADPRNPPAGVVGIVTADSTRIRVRADLNGDGTLQTAEPSEDVTYGYNDTSRVVTRDPGSGAAPILANVTFMRLSYFDAAGQLLGPLPLSTANAARVTSIRLRVTSEKRDSAPLALDTRITLRNR
jgi:prepilin-type N-terminal cleavage/methylation domain-containing protein